MNSAATMVPALREEVDLFVPEDWQVGEAQEFLCRQ